jgi:hypothetical protein
VEAGRKSLVAQSNCILSRGAGGIADRNGSSARARRWEWCQVPSAPTADRNGTRPDSVGVPADRRGVHSERARDIAKRDGSMRR